MRENRPSGLMRGGKISVIGFAFQPGSSRLLYTPFSPNRLPLSGKGEKGFNRQLVAVKDLE
jgi:hypothetical protein